MQEEKVEGLEWKTYINPEFKFTINYPFSDEILGIWISGNDTFEIVHSKVGFTLAILPNNDTNDLNP